MNDIINTDYDLNYKQQLEKAVLNLLSVGYQKNLTADGRCDTSILHDIGGINKEGKVIENTQENGVSKVVISKITELQREYVAQRRMRNQIQTPKKVEDEGREY